MVGEVRITARAIVAEAHRRRRRRARGPRGRGSAAHRAVACHPRRPGDLSGAAGAGHRGPPVARRQPLALRARARSSRSGASRWSPTPAPMSTRLLIGTPMGSTSRSVAARPAGRAGWRRRRRPGCPGRAIGQEVFLPYDVRGRAVLVLTGWSRHFGTPAYLSGHPFLTAAAAVSLVDAGAALVGIDSLNIDDIDGGERPAHSTLLAAGIPICEHLANLDRLPTTGFRFSAAPRGCQAWARSRSVPTRAVDGDPPVGRRLDRPPVAERVCTDGGGRRRPTLGAGAVRSWTRRSAGVGRRAICQRRCGRTGETIHAPPGLSRIGPHGRSKRSTVDLGHP